MKLVWCPETASKAYIDTVRSVSRDPDSISSSPTTDSSVAELVSAMAGGWKPQLIVETWARGGPIATSIGLASASRHTCGRHVCIVPDERSRSEYVEVVAHKACVNPEVLVGEEVEELMGGLIGVDFLVVDCRRKDDFARRMLRSAKLSQRGAVLVCKNASLPRRSSSSAAAAGGFRWRGALDYNARVVRCAYLPVGRGLEIAHVATGGTPNSLLKDGGTRWVRHVDQSGEEHVFRR